MRKGVCAVAAVMAASLCLSGWRGHEPESGWEIVQVTQCRDGASYFPSISPDGKEIYFISTCDLAGDNRDNSTEIFKWNDGTFTQLTDTRNCVINHAVLAPDGERVAFVTNCGFGGQKVVGEFELALWENGEVRVLTQGNGRSSGDPSWTPDGSSLVFQSTGDFDGHNSDGTQEIFLCDPRPDPPVFKQLTNAIPPGKCEAPVSTGSVTFCRCNADLPMPTEPARDGMYITRVDGSPTYDNPDFNWELVLAQLGGEARQVTKTSLCENGPPTIHPMGSMVVFYSSCPLREGDDSAGQYSLRALLPGRQIEIFPGLGFSGTSASFSGDGKRLAISSAYAGDDKNKDGSLEIFLVDNLPGPKELIGLEKMSAKLARITNYKTGMADYPRLSKDGKTMVFVSNNDDKEQNQDKQSEIYLAREK